MVSEAPEVRSLFFSNEKHDTASSDSPLNGERTKSDLEVTHNNMDAAVVEDLAETPAYFARIPSNASALPSKRINSGMTPHIYSDVTNWTWQSYGRYPSISTQGRCDAVDGTWMSKWDKIDSTDTFVPETPEPSYDVPTANYEDMSAVKAPWYQWPISCAPLGLDTWSQGNQMQVKDEDESTWPEQVWDESWYNEYVYAQLLEGYGGESAWSSDILSWNPWNSIEHGWGVSECGNQYESDAGTKGNHVNQAEQQNVEGKGQRAKPWQPSFKWNTSPKGKGKCTEPWQQGFEMCQKGKGKHTEPWQQGSQWNTSSKGKGKCTEPWQQGFATCQKGKGKHTEPWQQGSQWNTNSKGKGKGTEPWQQGFKWNANSKGKGKRAYQPEPWQQGFEWETIQKEQGRGPNQTQEVQAGETSRSSNKNGKGNRVDRAAKRDPALVDRKPENGNRATESRGELAAPKGASERAGAASRWGERNNVTTDKKPRRGANEASGLRQDSDISTNHHNQRSRKEDGAPPSDKKTGAGADSARKLPTASSKPSYVEAAQREGKQHLPHTGDETPQTEQAHIPRIRARGKLAHRCGKPLERLPRSHFATQGAWRRYCRDYKKSHEADHCAQVPDGEAAI